MADKPEPLQYLEAALKSPGRGATACMVGWAIFAAVLLLDQFRPASFQAIPWMIGLAWFVLLAAPILATVLALLHYGTVRKQVEPIPDFQVPTLAKPQQREPDLESILTGGPVGRFAEAIKSVHDRSRKTAAAPPNAGAFLNDIGVVERLRRRLREEVSDQARLYLNYMAVREADEVWADPSDPTIEELVMFGFLLKPEPGTGAKRRYKVPERTRQAIAELKQGARVSPKAPPPWSTYDPNIY